MKGTFGVTCMSEHFWGWAGTWVIFKTTWVDGSPSPLFKIPPLFFFLNLRV